MGFPASELDEVVLENVKGFTEDSACSCETQGQPLDIDTTRGNVKVHVCVWHGG